MLDPRDTLALKGLAILAIALHNYFHLLVPFKENEFEFEPERFRMFMGAVGDPAQVLQAVLSYLGHFGVQIFIFLSAYGLALRYGDETVRWKEFLWSRARKIYPMFGLAVAAWALFLGLPAGPAGPLELLWRHGVALGVTALGVITVLPGYDLPPIGPWWFLPFIMQFYCLWPALRRLRGRGLALVSTAGVAVTFLANGFLAARWSINLLETPVGHMPELCLGIAAARYGLRPGVAAVLAAAVLFALGNLYAAWWLATFPAALLLMLAAYGAARGFLVRRRLLRYAGGCSMALFFVNGFVRFPFLEVARRAGAWQAGVVLGLAAVAFAMLIAQVLTGMEGVLSRRPAALEAACR